MPSFYTSVLKAPSQKYRKPAVDWRRQMERGTMVYGRWYEGPYGSDYRPGNSHDRLANTKVPAAAELVLPDSRILGGLSLQAPFTAEEWEERKQYRWIAAHNIL
eukprot:569587-Amphidinium_carterae.1